MAALLATGTLVWTGGCKQPGDYRQEADRVADKIIAAKQTEALGKTEPFTIEKPSDTLRRRLMLEQNLPRSGAASLGSGDLEKIKHWPEKNYPPKEKGGAEGESLAGKTLTLTLEEALQVAARNSREYQSNKETVFRTALALDLERDDFRSIFAAAADGSYTHDLSGTSTVRGVEGSGDLSWSKMLKNGAELSASIALDVAKLLSGDKSASMGILADATITMPLLRGSGSWIVTESLTQAERDVVYALFDFEQYKKSMAVRVASEYLSVLQQLDSVRNAEANYKRLIASTNRAKRLAEFGRLSGIEVDQARQAELSARNRWISAKQSYARRLDSFRVTLGLPPDAEVDLDRDELERLATAGADLSERVQKLEEERKKQEAEENGTTPGGANAEITLVEPAREGGGPLEMDATEAVKLALTHRLDLKAANGAVVDAQRKVAVAADALRMGLDLRASGNAGEGRSLGSTSRPNAQLRPEKGSYGADASLDLPLHRTSQRNAYRESLISLERAVRNVQSLEDQIKVEIRDDLRNLLLARESYVIQVQAVKLAERRVKSTKLFLEAGEAQIRDVLEAEEALISAQNELTAQVVQYRVAELELQRDLDLLEVNEKGLWREYRPEENK